MSENRKFIVFFSWITALLFILTYFFSVITFSYQFLSSDFLEIVFGGLFASFGVMLLAEIKKYHINRRNTENTLYFTLLNLYAELVIEAKSADVYLKNLDSMVPDSLFSDRATVINSYIFSLRGIDYNPFRENGISKQWNEFRAKEFQCLDCHVIDCRTKLFLAINNEKLRALDQQITNYNPIARDHDVNITLNKIKANATERVRAIERVQDAFSATYENRYHWEQERTSLQSLEIGLPTENPSIAAFFKE